MDWRERMQAERRERFERDLADPERAELRDGVWYWLTNGAVIPHTCWTEAGLPIPEGQEAARAEDVRRSVEEYRETMRNHVPDAEELYEMRAAFGEGAEVVNVLMGKVTRL